MLNQLAIHKRFGLCSAKHQLPRDCLVLGDCLSLPYHLGNVDELLVALRDQLAGAVKLRVCSLTLIFCGLVLNSGVRLQLGLAAMPHLL